MTIMRKRKKNMSHFQDRLLVNTPEALYGIVPVSQIEGRRLIYTSMPVVPTFKSCATLRTPLKVPGEILIKQTPTTAPDARKEGPTRHRTAHCILLCCVRQNSQFLNADKPGHLPVSLWEGRSSPITSLLYHYDTPIARPTALYSNTIPFSL